MKTVIIHHTAVSYSKNPDQFVATNNYHKTLWPNFKSSMGFYVGYNYEINKMGKVYQARKVGEATAGAYELGLNNGNGIHVCLDGNFDIEKPSDLQIFALRDLLKGFAKQGLISADTIYFHRTYALNPRTGLAYKSCPGNLFPDLGFVRSLLKA